MQLFRNIIFTLAVLPLGVFSAAIPVGAKAGDVIPDSYIVVMKESTSTADFSAHRLWASDLHSESLSKRGDTGTHGLRHTYDLGTLKGYSGTFDKATINEISSRPEVAYVEPDSIMTTQATLTQNDATWGISRVSHTSPGSNTYLYDSSAGAGTFAYVIDTGVLVSHSQFGGRATWGYNAVSGSSNTDAHGHGTHVSGTIASTTYGLAKSARIIAVKVLGDNGSGSTSGVIAGIQWAAKDAQSNGRSTKSVANMSLGGGYSSSLNSAVNNAVAAGITFAVAAGNDNSDASNYSPASAASAIAVGATTSSDSRASYSNYGSTLAVFAPGSSITSTWIGSNSAINTISGTSMASPHVAGLAAYLIALEGLSSPDAVRARILELATDGTVSNPGSGSPSSLINNGIGQ